MRPLMRPFLRFSRLIPRLTLDVAVILSSYPVHPLNGASVKE